MFVPYQPIPLNLKPNEQVPKDILNCVGHVVGIQMQQLTLPNKTIKLPSGGPVVRS